jgi:hypothetical protein
MPSVQERPARVKILACRHVYTGRNQLNHQYRIYEVDAAREDGSLIREKLRAFEPLPVGEVVDVMVSPYNSERHGKSFTLTPRTPEGEGQASGGQLGKIAEAMEKTEKRIAALEAEVEALKSAPPQTGRPQAQAQAW